MPLSILSTIFRNYAGCGTILIVAGVNLLICIIPVTLLFYAKLSEEWKELLGFFVGVYMLTGGLLLLPFLSERRKPLGTWRWKVHIHLIGFFCCCYFCCCNFCFPARHACPRFFQSDDDDSESGSRRNDHGQRAVFAINAEFSWPVNATVINGRLTMSDNSDVVLGELPSYEEAIKLPKEPPLPKYADPKIDS